MSEYELLAGAAQYKRQLSAGEYNLLVWARYGHAGLRGRTITTARRIRSAVRDRAGEA